MKASSRKRRWMMFGVCCALTATAATAATQLTKTVQVTYRDVKIVVDGTPITPKDANGVVVEPFVMNGTTYLPVRAVSQALGKEVGWDEQTSTVYIGMQPSSATSTDQFTQETLVLLNQARSAAGLSALTTSHKLKEAAQLRASELAIRYSHTRPDETECFTVLDQLGLSYQSAGENIAYGQKNPDEVMQSWMNSDGHRANILSESFSQVGIGCYEKDGTLYWVQLFSS